MTTANATPVKSDISFGNPNDPPQGAINAKNPRSISDPGPQNPAIRDQFPGAFSPPATDVGSMPLSWASFNNAPRRIQNGGWARQVTQDSFAVADTNEGKASEFTTLLVSEWFTHTPPDILAENFGVPAETFQDIPLRDLYIFQGKLPGDLAADREAVSGKGAPPHPFTFTFGSGAPARETKGGSVRIADSRNFTVSTTIAAALVTVRPGGLREMHWHPNADEWQYWIKGKGQMTVFNTGPNAVTMDFNAGDIGYVKKNLGHYIKNTGDTDLQFLEVFKSSYFADVSLSDWISRTPPAMVAQHLNVSEATIAKFPKNKPEVMPE
jgi:oxalate decarboxylase